MNLTRRWFSCLANAIQSIQPIKHSNPTSIKEALQLLHCEQPNGIYAKVIIGPRSFTITPGDLVSSHRLTNCQIGDVIQLKRAYEIGTSSFILRQNHRAISHLESMEEMHTKAEELSLHIDSYALSRKIFLNPAYYCIEATVIANERGDKVHRKIVYRRKISLPTKNIKPHVTLLRIKRIEVNPGCF